MPELNLSQETILSLRAQAHALNPVVLLGAAGLSEPAIKEIDRALTAHGLVKVKAGRLEREERDAMFLTMAERLAAARIQVIGHTFVLFRPVPAKAPESRARPSAKKSAAKSPALRGKASPTGRTRAAPHAASPYDSSAPRRKPASTGGRGRRQG